MHQDPHMTRFALDDTISIGCCGAQQMGHFSPNTQQNSKRGPLRHKEIRLGHNSNHKSMAGRFYRFDIKAIKARIRGKVFHVMDFEWCMRRLFEMQKFFH